MALTCSDLYALIYSFPLLGLAPSNRACRQGNGGARDFATSLDGPHSEYKLVSIEGRRVDRNRWCELFRSTVGPRLFACK